MRRESVTFEGSDGSSLDARLQLPEYPPRAFALFAHCFTCGKDSRAATTVTNALVEAGFGVLRFDFTGLGSSEGDFANTDFSSNVEDLVAAAEWLDAHHSAPRLLVGHSLGGTAALVAATRLASVDAVATIGAPSDPAHVTHLFDGRLDDLGADGTAEVSIAGRSFRVKASLIEDLRGQRVLDAVAALRRPLLIFHSPVDEVVSVDHAATIFEAARHPRSFVSLDTADHLLLDRCDGEYVGAVLSAWTSRYVMEEQPARESRGSVHVGETGTGTYINLVQTGSHQFHADEPTNVGGDDAGPSPHELLQAALGACTAITLRMYANRKDMPLDHIGVDIDHEVVDRTDVFHRAVTLDGALSDDEREKLMIIANKCPVHRTLERGSEIETVEHRD